MKIVRFNKQYRVTLPKDLVEDKGWDDGETELRFVEDEHGRVWLKPIKKGAKRKGRMNNKRTDGGVRQ